MAQNSKNTYLMGKDVKIVSTSENLIELNVADGDLVANTFVENISASLNRRLFSELEELVLHRDYGGFISAYVSDIVTLRFVNLMLLMMKNELLKDPRVSSITDITIEFSRDNRRIIFAYDIITITSQKINNIIF